MSEILPPRRAELFAASLIADAELRDAVLGDLAEEFGHIARRSSVRTARAWYWWQLVRSSLPLSLSAVGRGGLRGWLRLLAAVMVGYALLVALVIVSDGMLYRFLAASAASNQMLVGSVLTGVLCAIGAGYVAALIGGRSPIAPGIALGAASIAVGIATLSRGGDGLPAWYWIALEGIVLPSCVVGALLRARQLVNRTHARNS